MTKPSRTTNAVEVSLRVLREIEIDDNIYRLYIYASSKKIRTDKVTTDSVAKIMENTVAVVLQHASMRIEAGISKLSDLLRQKLHTVRRVAEYDGLIDL